MKNQVAVFKSKLWYQKFVFLKKNGDSLPEFATQVNFDYSSLRKNNFSFSHATSRSEM